jgi:hypothetical protein
MNSCKSWGFVGWLPNIEACLGRAYACTEQVAAGQNLVRKAIENTRAIGILVHTGRWLAWLAEALLGGDDIARAHACALEAVAMSKTHNERGNEAEALRILGEIDLHKPNFNPATVGATLNAALSSATACGMRPLAVQCLHALARLHQLTDSVELAQSYRKKAIALGHEIGLISNPGSFL